jgi:hypothetical protein
MKSAIERFWANVDVDTLDGCWPWKASLDSGGYGQFYAEGKHVLPHRFAYELIVGPIPKGAQLDHLCRVRHCVNPGHLEPVSPGENNRRGYGISAVNLRKTHCKRGHPFDFENTYLIPNEGGRSCRICRHDAVRQYRERRRV